MAEQFAPNVWQEFLHDVESGIEADLLTPFIESISKASVRSWIVRVGNARCDGIAQEFRSVEMVVPIVIACDDFTAHGVASPF